MGPHNLRTGHCRASVERLLGLNEGVVVVHHEYPQMIQKSFALFCRAPGASEKTVHICSEHSGRVIECEEWIKTKFL